MAVRSQVASTDQFEAYFRKADVDCDGRISGSEAVSFFQGSNLPKHVLAQIWTQADQKRNGFLGRAEFYNALRLVTVAQSRRELTPDIVKAALHGPASAKIPAPQINFSTPQINFSTPHINSVNSSSLAPRSQVGSVVPTASHNINLGLTGTGMAGSSLSYTPQNVQFMRPPQNAPLTKAPGAFHGIGIVGYSEEMEASTVPRTPYPVTSFITSSNMLNSSLVGTATGALSALGAISISMPAASSQVQAPLSMPHQSAVNGAKESLVHGNGLLSGSGYGSAVVYSSTPSKSEQEYSMRTYSTTSLLAPTVVAPVSTVAQPSLNSNMFQTPKGAGLPTMQPLGSQLGKAKLGLEGFASSSSIASSVISGGTVNSSSKSILPWPKMKPPDFNKYSRVFFGVDTDRDGKITGEQARDLFLSWKLPREVLKQIWDLSDQDNDSMLSLKEFCFALYLMERYREGCSLPEALPINAVLDESFSFTAQSNAINGSQAPVWGTSGAAHQGLPATSSPSLRPPFSLTDAQRSSMVVVSEQKSSEPSQDSFLNLSDGGTQKPSNSMPVDVTISEKKVDETEMLILDSKEKMEFYRNKMQDLVLYKSRCDNRLNEILERALADKHEAESLGKKYEEKYKQVADVSSKLTVEEATFRDAQGRKAELHQAIINMEQGGSADGILQVRADRIKSDLDELMKAFNERCEKHGLDVKSTSTIELPLGWEPGVHGSASTWDEDWDKFEDEGFVVEKAPRDSISISNSPANDNQKFAGIIENESVLEISEDGSGRSPGGSSVGRLSSVAPPHEMSNIFIKSTEIDVETHGSFDESTWGAFDTHDDVDSVWRFNPSSSKDLEAEKQGDLFEFDDFDGNSIASSPAAEGIFERKSSFADDSIPGGSPFWRAGSSPPRYSDVDRKYSRFDSISSVANHDAGGLWSPRGGKLARFDSISSSTSAKEFGYGHGFSSFDEADPFGSDGPFKVSPSPPPPPSNSSQIWSPF